MATQTVSRFMNELLGEAQDQGWKIQRKENHRYVFCAPPARARPGLTAVSVDDPFHDSHGQKVVRKRLRAAGFKFDESEVREMVMSSVPKTNGAGAPSARVETGAALVRRKLNDALTAISEAETALAELEAETGKLRQLHQLLKEIK
jgi:hypothetical protein